MGRPTHALKVPSFFSFKFGGTGIYCFVPNVFSDVFPDAFLKMFAIAPEFCPIWFAQSSTPLYIN